MSELYEEITRQLDITKEEFDAANESSVILELVQGKTESSKDFYAYIALNPKDYISYKEREARGESVDLNKAGTMLANGWGLEPPESVKQEMQEKYGADHKMQETILKEIEKAMKLEQQ